MSTDNPHTKKRNRSNAGCGFSLVVGSTIVILLIVNSIILNAIFAAAFPKADPRITDPVKYVCSVIAIFFEYWAYDRISLIFRSRSQRNDQ